MKRITECLVCQSRDMKTIFDLGDQPPANALQDHPNTFIQCAQLAAQMCKDCTHVMQKVAYDAKALFDKYLYVSGTSNTLNEYFDWFASNVARHYEDQAILEIASNDGTLLRKLKDRGCQYVEGVEPAKNLVAQSAAKGVYVTQDYWPFDTGNQKYGVIIAMNVLAHNDKPIDFLKGIHDALEDDGVAFIQVSQMHMLENGEYDTIYHEHFSFFTITSFNIACSHANMRVAWTQCVSVHGGSMLAAVCKRDAYPDPERFEEGRWNVGSIKRYSFADGARFTDAVTRNIQSMRSIIKQAKRDGYVVVMVGCAAKAVTLMQAVNDDPHVIVDESPMKIGKFLPNSTQQIIPLNNVAQLREKCLFIIGAWNFKAELIRKLQMLRNFEDYDSVVTPFPQTYKEPLYG